ncbi:MAG: hypothetical protein HAW67_06975 [Endozoicomonadaceae bacterium]|nr:hypothetical protein [Endozoicomonadaceae bacterium]
MKGKRWFLKALLGVACLLSVQKSANGSSNPLEELFEQVVGFIAEAIIQYYAGEWLDGTKDQVNEYNDNKNEQTEKDKNLEREAYGRLADSINAVSVEIDNNLLMRETEPPFYPCNSGALVIAAKGLNQKVQEDINNQSTNINDSNVSQYEGNPEFSPDNLRANFNIELLTDNLGLSNTGTDGEQKLALGLIDKIVGVGVDVKTPPESSPSGLTKLNFAVHAEKISRFNLIKNSLHFLFAQRAKHQNTILPSEVSHIENQYRPNLGLSKLELLAIDVDMYSQNGELLTKINGESGPSALSPLVITLCEMKAVENKLLLEITERKRKIAILDASLGLNQLGKT